MPLPQAASLELRLRTIKGLFTIMFATFNTRETIRLGKNLVNMLRVIGPVGRDIQRAVACQAVRNQRQELRRDDPPFVMAFLRPRVREVQVQAREGVERNLVRQHLDGVVIYEA